MAHSGWFRWILGVLGAISLAACGQAAAPSPSSPPPPSSPVASAAAKTPASAAQASQASAAASAGAAATKGRTQIKAAYVPVLAFSALYRAVDKGYLADEGLDLDLTVVQSGSNAMVFLGSGQLDAVFGNIGDTFFNAVNRGLNLKIVAGISYAPHDPKVTYSAPLVVRKQLADSGAIKGVADLKARKVAMNAQGGIQEYNLQHALEPAGLSVNDVDVTILAFPDMVPALKNGAVDAAMPPEPFFTSSLEQGFVSMLVPNPAPDALITALMYGGNLLSPGKEAVANGLLKAVRRASNELQSRNDILSDENVAIWAKWSKLPEAEIRKQVLNVFAQNLVVDVNSVLDQQQVMLKAGRLEYKQPLPEASIFDSRFLARK